VTPSRWDWSDGGPHRLEAELAAAGLAWVHAPDLVEAAEREPWTVAERLLGVRPLLLERQPIRAVPGGRSFASGRMAAPFHSDSQTFLGVPPHVQVMACRRAAEAGGEGVYLDTWALLERVENEDLALLEDLFTAPRRQPFVFGDVCGPTVTARGGSLVFTHTARPLPDDSVAARLRPFVDAAPVLEVRAAPGDLVLIQNHRLLHGRRAFEDDGRWFTRLLLWRPGPWPAPERWLARARPADGLGSAGSADVQRRLGVVLELLRGVPPGVLSAREGIPESELYAWRDAALGGAAGSLASAVTPGGPPAPRPPDPRG
jgi:gamma-butyrobetaine dioxygenase